MSGGAALPTALTNFVGRRKEVADVRRVLQRSRLVTITGIAGVGKTRVALRAAQLMRRAFGDGVAFVELSGHSDPAALEQVIGHALEVAGGPSPLGVDDLVKHLADRRLLLVLDTCEHLAEACSRLVQELLPAAPGLHILITSRHALRAPGEHTVIVAPMAVPEPGLPVADLAHTESVALFLDRVAAVDPAFDLTAANAETVGELCRRLDGIPLALELAAVRARAMPVERLLRLVHEHGRLGQASGGEGRHATMQAAIAWSHDLCTPGERLLWARLTVFAGTFDLAAAETVCSDDELPDGAVYPALAGLIEKSIVIRDGDARHTVYRMPDAIREFAAAGGEAVRLRERHREHYLALARRLGTERTDQDRVEALARARADWPNLRAALESYAADPEALATGLEMGLLLGHVWVFGGRAQYGRRYLERLLAVTDGPDRVRMGALLQLAHIAVGQGDLPAARRALAAAEEPAARLGVLAGLHTTKMLGTLSFAEGDLEAAERHLRASVEGLKAGGGIVLRNATVELGLTLLLAGRTGEAGDVLARARALCRAEGDGATGAWAALALALVRRLRGEHAEAEELARAALRTLSTLQITFGRAFCVEVLGWLAADRGRPVRAVTLLSAAHRLWGHEVSPLFGSPVFAAERARYDRQLRDALGPQYARAAAAGRALSAEEAIADALSAGSGPPEPAAASVWAPLTPRETDVAELVAAGLTNRLIAQRLVIARRTVDTHVENILAKLGFSGRSQIAAWVTRRR